MRAATRHHLKSPPTSSAVVRREALRILCAFGLYLALHLAGIRSPLHRAYTALVMDAGSMVLPWIQHFPAVATLENLDIRNLDVPVMLLICLFAVSTRMRTGSRITRFAVVLALLFASSVAGALLWSQVMAAEDLQKSAGLLLYLPGEFRLLDAFKYLLYDFGMEVSTFVLLALTVVWNSPEIAAVALPALPKDEPRYPPFRHQGVIVIAAAVLVFAAWASWSRVRESIPLHSHAHARFGDLFLQADNTRAAEAQYRAAVTGGTTESGPWLQLAELLRRRGAPSEADRVLTRGLSVVVDAGERRLLQDALSPRLKNP